MWEKKLKRYDELISKCPNIERKGKTVPYTSANGYMFSILNKDGELGIRFSNEVQKQYMESWNTTFFKSHGATMHGYVLIPEVMLQNLEHLAKFLIESYNYVIGLKPK